MQQKPRVKRRLALLKVYEMLEERVEELHQTYKISCQRGCNACCRMPVMMTGAEAEYIVDRYPSAVRAALPKLRAHHDVFVELMTPMADKQIYADDDCVKKVADDWWARGETCALLVDGECSVYEARPFPCRNYHVMSDPALCHTEEISEVEIVELVEKREGFRVLAGRQPDGEVTVGYLPFVVLDAAKHRL